MTTETKQVPRDAGLAVLLGATVAALLAGALVALGAWLTSGADGLRGAAAGVGLVVTVLALGSFVVHVVAHAMPSASLLVALMTYGLQIVVLVAVFTGLSRSGDLGETLHPEWLAAGVVGGTLTWVVAQIWLSTRARIPLYDLPAARRPGHQEAGAK